MEASQSSIKNIVLTELDIQMKEAFDDKNKFVTVIDPEGKAEIFFKYQGTTLFSIAEKEMQPENLCKTFLKMIPHPRTLTINFLDLDYQHVFNKEYFPEEIVDPAWVQNFKNIEQLRLKFPEEFKDPIGPNKDFKIVFLFKKNNVPAFLSEKTIVLNICTPDQLKEIKEAEANKKEESAKKSEVKTPIQEENKVDPKVSTSTNKAPPKDQKTQVITTAPTSSKPKTNTTTSTTHKAATSNTKTTSSTSNKPATKK